MDRQQGGFFSYLPGFDGFPGQGPGGFPGQGPGGFPGQGLGGFPGQGPGGFPGQGPGGFPGQGPGGFPGQGPGGFPGQGPGGFPGQGPGGFPGQGPGGFPGQGPGGFPGQGPGGGGQGQTMQLPPPPSDVPQFGGQAYGGPTTYAVDPGAFYRCLYRYTRVRLRNGQRFWFYPVFIGRQSVAGYRWRPRRRQWVYFGIDTDRIVTFQC